MQRIRSFQWLLGLGLAVSLIGITHTASAECAYERSCWSAELSTIFHDVSGTVTIVDETTLQVDDFTYDGGGPAVYFYLGATESNVAFTNGLRIQPLLSGTAYDGDSLTLTLPPGETLDGYEAVSVWCDIVNVSFGSGTFEPNPLPGDLDCDCDVDFDDLNVLLASYGADDGGDVDGDGDTDFDDLNILLANYGM